MPEEKRAPLVGQFSGPPGNSPRTPAPLPGNVETPATEEDKKENTDDVARPKTPAEKAEAYAAGLAAVGLTHVQARGILEKVLVNGDYEERIKLGPVPVVICTRKYSDVLRTLRFLELEKPTYAMSINDVVARYNMAASLVSFGDETFERPSKKDGATDEDVESAFHYRLSFVMDLPVVTSDRLMQIVHEFDQRIGAVFAEGSPEDF
jgi:hypothetical protein